jgi:hypothetical protein
VVFPQGAAAYAAALRKEVADRKLAGTSLLMTGSVTASATARQQLRGGQVDSRLLLTLAELASQWPVTITALGDRGPGASSGVPKHGRRSPVLPSCTPSAGGDLGLN